MGETYDTKTAVFLEDHGETHAVIMQLDHPEEGSSRRCLATIDTKTLELPGIQKAVMDLALMMFQSVIKAVAEEAGDNQYEFHAPGTSKEDYQ